MKTWTKENLQNANSLPLEISAFAQTSPEHANGMSIPTISASGNDTFTATGVSTSSATLATRDVSSIISSAIGSAFSVISTVIELVVDAAMATSRKLAENVRNINSANTMRLNGFLSRAFLAMY